MDREVRDRRWPWLPFVELALAAALVPGFLLGGLLAWAAWRELPLARSFAALAQAHGHAQLAGWGGAMILGVGLHFLPRLRGSPLAGRRYVPLLFTLFASGLVLRVAGQAAAPLAPGGPAAGWWRAATAAGAVMELAAAGGVVLLLARTVAGGPAVAGKRAFQQVQPLFAGAFVALLLALAAWAAGALPPALVPPEPGAPAIDRRLDDLAQEFMVFGFVAGISLAMSARLFSLFFRVRPTRPRLLALAGLLLALGLLAGAGSLLLPSGPASGGLRAAAGLLEGLGLLAGTAAVRVFEPRVAFPGDRGSYRVWRDPAALGAASAYAWAVAGALALVLAGAAGLGLPVLPGPVTRDLAVHTLGAGFMTLLILAVAPVLLPGFGDGGRPSAALVAWSIGLGNAAAALRTAPGWAGALGADASGWALPAMAAGGVLGLGAVALLAVNLAYSLRRGRAGRAGAA